MDALSAAEVIALAQVLAELLRDIKVLAVAVDRHLDKRMERLGRP